MLIIHTYIIEGAAYLLERGSPEIATALILLLVCLMLYNSTFAPPSAVS